MKISVVINTLNAAKHLEKVLLSVQNFDEVVVCDMGSTDNTLNLAEKYHCTVVHFENNHYHSAEPARTFAIQSAMYEWVLVVDADEIVPEALRLYLYGQIKQSGCSAGIRIPRKNYFMGRFMRGFYPDRQLRFFKKEGTVWPPHVHTQPTVQGDIMDAPKQKELAFIHLANDSVFQCIQKMNQYTENERIKRRGKKYGTFMLLFRPAFHSFRNYILKGGFLDGKPGLVYAIWLGMYKFTMMAKLEEDKITDNDYDDELKMYL
jgi:glycosyltransferase involved in cell wall biosynthesis